MKATGAHPEGDLHPAAGGGRKSKATATAALVLLACTCIAGFGYCWRTHDALASMDARTALTVLEHSHNETERKQALLVVTDEVMRLLDALRAAGNAGDEASAHAQQYLDRLAKHAKEPR